MNSPAIEAFLQAWIILTSILSLTLLAPADAHSRWGHVVGLAGQPAWLYTTWVHGQYGMLIVSCAFTTVYLWGVWRFWIEPLFITYEVDHRRGIVTFNKPPPRGSVVTVTKHGEKVTAKVTPPPVKFPKI